MSLPVFVFLFFTFVFHHCKFLSRVDLVNYRLYSWGLMLTLWDNFE